MSSQGLKFSLSITIYATLDEVINYLLLNRILTLYILLLRPRGFLQLIRNCYFYEHLTRFCQFCCKLLHGEQQTKFIQCFKYHVQVLCNMQVPAKIHTVRTKQHKIPQTSQAVEEIICRILFTIFFYLLIKSKS